MIARTLRFGSITKTQRTVTVELAPGWIIPYFCATEPLSAIMGYMIFVSKILARFSRQATWAWIESIDRPMRRTLRLSNSAERRANSVSSVEQTGVKSAGCEKKTTHLPSAHFE